MRDRREQPILMTAENGQKCHDGTMTQTHRLVKPQPPDSPTPRCHPNHVAKYSEPYLDSYCGEPKTVSNPRGMSDEWCWWQIDNRQCLPTFTCHYGTVGDRLWVREPWTAGYRQDGVGPILASGIANGFSRAAPGAPDGVTDWCLLWRTRPSIHMPKWACRTWLEITEVRVERIQDISERDARAEGMEDVEPLDPPSFKACPDCAGQRVHGAFGANYGVTEVDCTTCDTPVKRYRWLWDSLHGPGAWDRNEWVFVLSFRR